MSNPTTHTLAEILKQHPDLFADALMLAAVHYGLTDEHDAQGLLALAETPDVSPAHARARRIRLLTILLERLIEQLRAAR